MKSFKQYIKESNDAIAKFGNVLFGDFRGKKESDTDYEFKVFNAIQSYVRDAMIVRELPNYLEELIALKRVYPDVLEPENDTSVLYRGMVINDYAKNGIAAEIKNAIVNDAFTHEAIHNKMKYFRGKINYYPLNQVESWSTDEKVAWRFAKFQYRSKMGDAAKRFQKHLKKVTSPGFIKNNTYLDDLREFLDEYMLESGYFDSYDNEYAVVLEFYKPKKNQLIFNSKFLNKLLGAGTSEKEVMRLDKSKSPVPMHIWVPEIEYLKMTLNNKFKRDPRKFYEFFREHYDESLPTLEELKKMLKENRR